MRINELVHRDLFIKYLYSYYFTTVTMVTVGFGDISPQNDIEIGVSVGLMFISCVVFGYIMNKIGSIFNSLQQVNEE